MTRTIKAKEFCLSDFGVQKVHYSGGTTYDSTRGKQQTNIGFMKAGKCIFSSSFVTVECSAGDLIYIPEGTRYISQSQGDPDVEYYCVHLTFRTDKDGKRFDQSFGMQKVEGLDSADIGNEIPAMYELLESGDELSRIVALEKFYRLFSNVLLSLKPAAAPDCSPCVLTALDYIQKHLAEEYSIAALAKECFVSESRLYHLFREEMHTTPVAYKNELRILRSIEYIKSGYKTVEEISEELGFRSASYFRRVFKDITGMTPMEYRKKYSLL
ncbi:MAG: helix-turn-helix transcriptional regulator [Clostridia bacterium]|nr:helix-turn-helix transcriptional regulator [Clostridia bacterium]